jgi:hypothetical protein
MKILKSPSLNLSLTPLNPQGALEVGRVPCRFCNSRWEKVAGYVPGYKKGRPVQWKKRAITKLLSCKDSCPQWKAWQKLHEES